MVIRDGIAILPGFNLGLGPRVGLWRRKGVPKNAGPFGSIHHNPAPAGLLTKIHHNLTALGLYPALRRHMFPNNDNAGDLLIGANAIANHLGITQRQTYRLIYDDLLPTFKIGGAVAARRSTLNRWLTDQEARAA